MPRFSRRHVLTAAGAIPAGGLVTSVTAPAGAATARASATASGPTSRAMRLALADEIGSDVVGHHAGLMHGVPLTYDWARHPRLTLANHPGSFTAMNPWGQIYEWAQGSPATNVRVACRDMCGWILSRSTGRWHRVAAARGVYGANYVEDFVGNVNVAAPLRNEPDGSVSSTLGGGYNFHFAPYGQARVPIDPTDIGGVVTLYSARVIKDDPNGPDERAQARYLASSGGDYWLNAETDGSDGQVGAIGCGKARWLTSTWKTVTMSTLKQHHLRRTCPPVQLLGRG